MKAGKLSELILNRSVLKKIRNKRKEVLCGAKTGNDAVILRTDGDLTAACAASSSFFYIPEDFTDSEACLASVLLNAELVVLRAANSVSAEWGEPFALMPVLVLPESFEEAELKRVADTFEEMAEYLNLQIAGGHSEVSADVKKPVFSVTVFGNREYFKSENKKAYGQDIIMTGYAALEATRTVTVLCRKKLEERFAPLYIEQTAEYTRQLSVIQHMKTAKQNQAAWMHDLSKIPIRQETIEFSEYMGFNPYTVPSLGAALITAQDGNGLVKALQRQGISAAVIGKVTEGKDRVVVNQEERRYLEQPR